LGGGNGTSILVSIGAMAGYRMEVGWKQMHIGHRVAFSFAAALIDNPNPNFSAQEVAPADRFLKGD
jgi:hypothetical protein